MKPQHVAVIFGKLDALDPSGAQVITLANGLAEKGYRVTLLTSSAVAPELHNNVTLLTQDRGTRLVWLGMIRFQRWLTKQLNALNADQTISLLSMMPGQIIVSTTGLTRPRIDACIDQDAPILERARQSLSRFLPSNLLRRHYEKRALADESLRVTIAQTSRAEAELQAYGLKSEVAIRTAAMPLPQTLVTETDATTLRDKLARAFGLDPKAYWVCHAFGSAGLGGLEPMLRAFKPLVEQGVDAQLLLAGPVRYTHLAWIAQLGLRDRVRFVGKTTQAAELMAACDLAMFPTRYDPSGWGVIDALRTDTPVITTDACGLADLVQQRGGTVLPSPADPAALLDAIRSLHTAWLNGDRTASEDPVTSSPQPPLLEVVEAQWASDSAHTA